MILARYRHRLPADYDMRRVRDRVTARGPLWDDAPGLVFKAFAIEDRARGAGSNAYSSLYLWRDPLAAVAFFAGPRFVAVIESFGRPPTETWLPFAVDLGPASGAGSLAVAERSLAEGTDLAAEQREETERGASLAREDDVVAAVCGLDPTGWRLTRFVLRAGAPRPGEAEIAHLSGPGLQAMRTDLH